MTEDENSPPSSADAVVEERTLHLRTSLLDEPALAPGEFPDIFDVTTIIRESVGVSVLIRLLNTILRISPNDLFMMFLLLFAFGPFLFCLLASGIAGLFGERLNESDAPNVPYIGEFLYESYLMTMLWYMSLGGFFVLIVLVTLPFWSYFKIRCIVRRMNESRSHNSRA